MEHVPVVQRLAGDRPDLFAEILERDADERLRQPLMDASPHRLRNPLRVPVDIDRRPHGSSGPTARRAGGSSRSL